MIRWYYGGGEVFDAFNAQPKNIAELLSDTLPAKIKVPQFQRGYSWEKKHVEDFWKDIVKFRDESAKKDGPEKYFLGPIVVMPIDKTTIHLLDGQQRLATATILFSILRDVAHDLKTTEAAVFAEDIQNHLLNKEDIGHSLELGDLDKTYFSSTIQTYPSPKKKSPPTLRSHRNIQNAHDILLAKVKAMIAGRGQKEALEELKVIRKIVRTDLIMASIPVTSERDAFRIFESLNDRGLRLSVPDLLLNYLMGKAEASERGTVREHWNDMMQSMGKRNANRFLRHMWVSKYGDLKNIDLFTALKAHIEEHKVKSVEFARSCAEECERYVELLNADPTILGDAAVYIGPLVRELEVESALPLLLAIYSTLTPTDLTAVTKYLLVFVTQYSVVVKLDSGDMESALFKLARDVRAMVADKQPAKNIVAFIKKILSSQAPTLKIVKESVAGLTLSSEEAVYMLSRIARHMQTGTKEIALGEANLEHIFPKKPSAEWGKSEIEQLEPHLWHIGNLTMLGKRLNTSAASRGYKTKLPEYKKSELVMAQELAKKFSKWDAASIEQRAQSMAKSITEIWDFDNPSRV